MPFSHVCRWSRLLSAATWFNLDQDERPIHYYVLFWLIALIPILSFAPTSGWPGLVLVGLAFYRLQDLIFSTLDNAFLLTTRSSPSKDWGLTLVILALVNIIQIVLIFAIAYLILTGRNPKSFYNPPTSRFDEFYLSWVSLPPLGGGASPESIMAKILTITEEGIGLLIIVIAIGRFLSFDPKSHGTTPQLATDLATVDVLIIAGVTTSRAESPAMSRRWAESATTAGDHLPDRRRSHMTRHAGSLSRTQVIVKY